MISKCADPYYKPTTLLFVSQSNGIHPINLIGTWPQRERYDRSALWANRNEGFGPVRTTVSAPAGTHGCLVNSLAARYRDAGRVPAIIHYGVSGTPSSYWFTNRATVASWMAARLAELVDPDVRGLLWYQGESDAIDGNGTDWQTNVAAVVGDIRSAVGLPALPLFVVMIPSNYSLVTFPFLAETRAAQAALVSADEYAQSIEVASATYVADNIHLNQPALAALARQIVPVTLA